MVWNWDLLAFIGLWGIMNGNTRLDKERKCIKILQNKPNCC